jgi:hypothetical protein
MPSIIADFKGWGYNKNTPATDVAGVCGLLWKFCGLNPFPLKVI